MALSNRERVGKGLELLREGLAPYILRELQAHYGDEWWPRGVESQLRPPVGREALTAQGSEVERFAQLDIHALLVLMWYQWNEVFHSKLGHIGRTYVSELRDARNKWAHQEAFSLEDAHRALDTTVRLLQMITAEEADEVQHHARELLRQRFEDQARRELRKSARTVTETDTPTGLAPWREVVTPHPDVASGRYRQAEFAADLAQVISGEAEAEYQDPHEFFRRTYLTEGLNRLLVLALRRLSGTGGDPVVELQTNFGGGKTHSLLSLYHFFSPELTPGEVPGLDELLSSAEVSDIPKAHRAVFVGMKFNAATPRKKPDGTVIHTMWGELAYRLGEDAGGQGAEAYALVADADRVGVSPGSDTLKELFDAHGPTLILIDEWVAFARQLYGVEGLPAGSFDANMTFAQALTEAARRSSNTLVVASIPASDVEIGGEGGLAALDRLRNTFGRLEAVWKPASADESFEIVRRRLFQPLSDPSLYAARDAVCRAFVELYRENRGYFPRECAEADYQRRLKSAYPIHPELFDRLYQDWSTLEKFQRTRGVLRLMASVIHELWERDDKSLLIMPGTIPLDSARMRYELTRYLPEGWDAIIDKDIDGPESRPLALDRANPNLGRYSACRRVSRAVFVGSAPSVASQKVRGIEEVRVKLGCVQPGEAPATFGDALRRLSEELTYLYSDGSRYWFDTHPTVNRLAADRAEEFTPEEVEAEIVRRLRGVRQRADFAGVHVAPQDGSEVPDEMAARLVALSPAQSHSRNLDPSPAISEAIEILEHRGSTPRQYRNMLVFLAPDRDRMRDLNGAVRQWLAWRSIDNEQDQLNLDTFQRNQVENSLRRAEETVATRFQETYSWLLVPTQRGTEPIEWETTRIPSGDESFAARAAKRLKNAEQLITQWSPALLRMELDRWLWNDEPHLGVQKLWEYLATYCYLPRLRDVDVLLDAIKEGIRSRDYFGYATSVTEDGRYQGLIFGQAAGTIYLDEQAVIIKPDVAAQQLKEEAGGAGEAEPSATGTAKVPSGEAEPSKSDADQPTKAREPRRFFGVVELGSERMGSKAGQVAEEVIQHLNLLPGSNVRVTLEIEADIPDGVPEEVVRTITENCRTLKFKQQGFEEG